MHITNHRRENLSLSSPVNGREAGGGGGGLLPRAVEEAAPTPRRVGSVVAASLAATAEAEDEVAEVVCTAIEGDVAAVGSEGGEGSISNSRVCTRTILTD